jgi:hypothetical protein
MNRTFQAAKLLIALSLPIATSSTLSAAIVGTFDISGGTADVTATGINWTCTAFLTIAPCPANTGNAVIDNASGGLAPFFLEGVFVGDISDAGTPLNRPIFVPNWLTITPSFFNSTVPTVALDLTFLPIGVQGQADCFVAPAPGQTCTPPVAPVTPFNPKGLSQFNLLNTATGFTASFDVRGVTRDLVDGSMGTFIGTFSATVNGESYQDAIAQIEMGTAPPFTYAASFVLSAVPEPSYLAAFAGLALVVSVIALYRKRRLQRQ